MVRTQYFTRRVANIIPGGGTKILQATQRIQILIIMVIFPLLIQKQSEAEASLGAPLTSLSGYIKAKLPITSFPEWQGKEEVSLLIDLTQVK